MRVYVEVYGCSQNHGEAAEIERDLVAHGHAVTRGPDGADVGVLVTCGVIGPTEDRMLRRWEMLGRRVPRLVVTGCLVPLRADRFDGPARERTTFVRIGDQGRLSQLLETPRTAGAPPSLPPSPGAFEEVVIAQGCTSHCTYCFSRLARGPLRSRPMLDLADRVRRAVDRGAVEVRLSSLDTSCWGSDHSSGDRLPELVQALSALPGNFRLRVGMASPQSLAPIAPRLFDAMAHDRVFRFLHLPVQSGSDRILLAMRRGYTTDDVRTLVREARTALPDLMLATDVIVGYPGETEPEFDATMDLIAELDPEVVNVTRYSHRPSTPASRLPTLPSGTLKRRSRRLTELRLRVARARMERWVGWSGPALLVEHGRDGSTMGRLPNYLPVVLDGELSLGQEVDVRVVGARSTYLLGRLADGSPPRLRVGC